jgi:hypothetical protein
MAPRRRETDVAKRKERRSLELSGSHVSSNELRNIADRVAMAASKALRLAEFYVVPGAADGDELHAMRFARKNLERARASYIVACQVHAMHWPEFESRYNETARAVTAMESRAGAAGGRG